MYLLGAIVILLAGLCVACVIVGAHKDEGEY